MGKKQQYCGELFGNSKVHRSYVAERSQESQKLLIALQMELIERQYGAVCLNVKQLAQVLNVGESNVYELLGSGKLHVKTIGKRKVVPIVSLAEYLVNSD